MTKKEQCKIIMGKLFGPATANKVDIMNEDTCVIECKQKVMMFLGPAKAAEFDKIV